MSYLPRLAFLIVVMWASPGAAQIKSDAPAQVATSPELGPAQATRYRVGAVIRGRSGPVQNIRVMVVLPWECDEQQVHVVEEDFSPQVQVDQRTLKGGEARQLLVYVPQLGPREEARALITFDVLTHTQLPPKETASLHVPVKPAPLLKQYLGRSPYIDVGHRRIRKAIEEAVQTAMLPGKEVGKAADANQDAPEPTTEGAIDSNADADDAIVQEVVTVELGSDTEPDSESASDVDLVQVVPAQIDPPETSELDDWQRIEAYYDFVLQKVAYEEGEDKSSVQTLSQGVGDCQAIGALFVAMCRTAKVPARLVWVHDHQYAEFYLENADGEGRWYPVETAGQRAFGGMPTPRVILQKGDNFRVPERPRDRLRYASDFALFLSAPNAKPQVTYVRERL